MYLNYPKFTAYKCHIQFIIGPIFRALNYIKYQQKIIN